MIEPNLKSPEVDPPAATKAPLSPLPSASGDDGALDTLEGEAENDETAEEKEQGQDTAEEERGDASQEGS
ncbi:MAG: hypothetical protein GY822_07990 [Deltaproteobacteria bacterium]|nr:hypothetical protein [Deltaproteobacteria bacterium]